MTETRRTLVEAAIPAFVSAVERSDFPMAEKLAAIAFDTWEHRNDLMPWDT